MEPPTRARSVSYFPGGRASPPTANCRARVASPVLPPGISKFSPKSWQAVGRSTRSGGSSGCGRCLIGDIRASIAWGRISRLPKPSSPRGRIASIAWKRICATAQSVLRRPKPNWHRARTASRFGYAALQIDCARLPGGCICAEAAIRATDPGAQTFRSRAGFLLDQSELRPQPVGNAARDLSRRLVGNREHRTDIDLAKHVAVGPLAVRWAEHEVGVPDHR